MISAKEAKQLSDDNEGVRKALLLVQAYELRYAQNKKMAAIDKKIRQAINDGQNFTFFSCKGDDAELLKVSFELDGYSVRRQSGGLGEEIYKLSW